MQGAQQAHPAEAGPAKACLFLLLLRTLLSGVGFAWREDVKYASLKNKVLRSVRGELEGASKDEDYALFKSLFPAQASAAAWTGMALVERALQEVTAANRSIFAQKLAVKSRVAAFSWVHSDASGLKPAYSAWSSAERGAARTAAQLLAERFLNPAAPFTASQALLLCYEQSTMRHIVLGLQDSLKLGLDGTGGAAWVALQGQPDLLESLKLHVISDGVPNALTAEAEDGNKMMGFLPGCGTKDGG